MQTIYIDIANKGVIPTINAKQGDVGRKFEICFSDSGVQYQIPNGAAFSAFYSGASGEGNYTDIGQRSAFTINGNSVIVELIEQMLVNHGDGMLCLVLGIPGGASIGTWNIPYQVEFVPGMNSEEATQYYTAFSQAVQNLPYPDTTLSVANKAADAAAVGAALTQKAPAGYGLGADGRVVTDCNLATANGWYIIAGATNAPSSSNYGWIFVSNRYGTMVAQDCYTATTPVQHLKRYCNSGSWGEWQCENPPMVAGEEYRTTELWAGKTVYTKLVNLGDLPANGAKAIPGLFTTGTRLVDVKLIAYGSEPTSYQQIPLAYNSGITSFVFHRDAGSIVITTNTTFTGIGHVYMIAKYLLG